MKFKLEKLPEKPLVTYILLSYNQEKYIRMSVEAALSQVYEKLEIIISDDDSSDSTYEIISDLVSSYNGPHKIRIYKNKINLGLAGNFNRAMNESNGDIIVISAGDDISLSHRVKSTVEYFNKYPNASAVLFSAYIIDESGKIIGKKKLIKGEEIEKEQELNSFLKWRYVTFGATRAIRREVHSIFGDLRPECPTEDTPLLFRSLLLGTNVITNNIGILYRMHEKNLGQPESLIKMDLNEIYQQYSDDVCALVGTRYAENKFIKIFNIWLREDKIARNFRIQIIMKKNISLSDYKKAIKCNAIPISEKIRYVASLIFKYLKIN